MYIPKVAPEKDRIEIDKSISKRRRKTCTVRNVEISIIQMECIGLSENEEKELKRFISKMAGKRRRNNMQPRLHYLIRFE